MRLTARLPISALLLLAACGASTSDPPVEDPTPPPFAGQRILWVGAHPDDEAVVAPVLAEACLHGGATCTLLVTTRGGTHCRFAPPGGVTCAEARAAEMAQVAALLGARLVQWDLPNSSPLASQAAALAAWTQAAGSEEALLAALSAAIADADPQVILTYDPRHGATCHPEHRVVSRLVLRAVEGRTPMPALRWRALHYQSQGGAMLNPPVVRAAGGTLHVLDANKPLPGGGGTYWSYFAEVMRLHRTQYASADVAMVEQAPAAQRVVHLLAPGPTVDTSVSYCN